MSSKDNIAEVIRRFNVSPAYLDDLREIFTARPYLKPRLYNNACRYKNVRTLQNEDDGKIYHENWIPKYIPESNEDQYFTVTISEKDRLDIVANYFYNTANFWWIIAIANNIMDPFDLPVGTVLRIPPIISLYDEGGILSGN